MTKSKRRKPLFTTEDGEDIYDRDKYFTCRDGSGIIGELTAYACENYYADTPYIKRFKHRHNAEAYLERHKPKFSEAQIIEAMEKMGNSRSLIGNLEIFKQALGIK